MNPQSPNRVEECRATLRELVREHSGRQAKIAELLIEVHSLGYWIRDYKSFADYCERELGMALRTAQHLITTYRRCREAGIDAGAIEEIGWSKLALLAKRLTPANRQEIVEDATELSHAALKHKYGIGKETMGAGGSKGAGRKASYLCLSKAILAAVARASAYTQSDDLQQNLEYMAERFLEDYPRRVLRGVSVN